MNYYCIRRSSILKTKFFSYETYLALAEPSVERCVQTGENAVQCVYYRIRFPASVRCFFL